MITKVVGSAAKQYVDQLAKEAGKRDARTFDSPRPLAMPGFPFAGKKLDQDEETHLRQKPDGELYAEKTQTVYVEPEAPTRPPLYLQAAGFVQRNLPLFIWGGAIALGAWLFIRYSHSPLALARAKASADLNRDLLAETPRRRRKNGKAA